MGVLQDQVAVVTGGGQGIGEAIVRAFAAEGAAVVVSDVVNERAEQLSRELEQKGGRIRGVCADVAREEDVTRLANEAMTQFGSIDVWVNNAGITRPAMLHKMTVEDFDQVIAVHARGTFLGIREAARRMMTSSSGGCILNVTSSAGLAGTIGQINYAAGKGAIVSMTKSAARELAVHGIRVNAVAPLARTTMTEKIRTDERLSATYLARIPLGRWPEPSEVAHAFVYLASPAASIVTGQVVCADGGFYMAS